MTARHGLTVVGLGPGDDRYLTLEAVEVLAGAATLWVRTNRHPTIAQLKTRFPELEIRSFDAEYEDAGGFDEVYGQIVARLMDEVLDHSVIYGVPGSPAVDETTVKLLLGLAGAQGVPVNLVHGLSYVEPVLAAVGVSDRSWLTLADGVEIDLLAAANAVGEVSGRPGLIAPREAVPTASLLISQVYDRHIAAGVKLWLGRFWPEDHLVRVVRAAGTPAESIDEVPLHAIDHGQFDHLTAVYVPPVDPLKDVSTFAGLLNVTRLLRAPGGCPWDREQTHDTLKPHLLEETYEVIEALDERDFEKLCGELGDLLFQVTIHAQVAAEAGEFEIADVLSAITGKLIRRHPHVFGEAKLDTSDAVLERWEELKQSETPDRQSILSGIPLATPALPYSYVVQRRAATQRFEWPDFESLMHKVSEELGELRAAVESSEGHRRAVEELGDLFFVLVSVGRWLKIEPEEALRSANRKFVRRFQHVERACAERGVSLRDLTPQELEAHWQEAKRAGISEEKREKAQ